jgi:lysophospholipase L1-like esterase
MDSVAFAAALTELALDTVIILTGTNDQRITGGASTFEANLRSFIARIRATLPGSDILFVMPCENERTITLFQWWQWRSGPKSGC